MTLVSTEWLNNNLQNVKIFDASWHMPNVKRNAEKEYLENHIPGALFWDIDEHSDKDSPFPHMLPNSDYWTRMLWSFGIKNTDHIIVYDFSDVHSACRLWFSLKYFGHKKVSILNGGMKKWLNENKITTNSFILVDARSRERFEGKKEEPRSGLKKGCIPGSKNIPFQECINSETNTFKTKSELIKVFEKNNVDYYKPNVFSCGSGVTACVLGLAYFLISDKNAMIYDGSFSEWGKK